MSKTRIFALSAIVLMLVAFLTNPSQEQHEETIRAKAISLLQQQAGSDNKKAVDFGIQLFGNTLIDQFMKKHVKIENYYLFSIAKISWEGQETAIGAGAFKQVWLSGKIDEKANEIVNAIKGR